MPLAKDTYKIVETWTRKSIRRFVEPTDLSNSFHLDEIELSAVRKALDYQNAFVAIDLFEERFRQSLNNPSLSQLTMGETIVLEALLLRINFKNSSQLQHIKKQVYQDKLQSMKLVNESEIY